MESKILAVVLFASFVFDCKVSGEEASALREKREDKEWIVTTLIEQPYVTKKAQTTGRNEDYEGYIPDILKKIGEKLNQKYRIREVPDGKYGQKKGGTWSGLIGELDQKNADLAAAPLTTNPQRHEVVDFTIPFMTFGTVVLLHKNTSYPVVPKTVHDLLATNLRYGVVNEGSTEQMIRESSDPDLSRLTLKLDAVRTQKEGVENVRNGKGSVAFLIEEKTASFWKRQGPCELMTIPVTQLRSREYALALPKASPHTAKINKVLQEMKESGELDQLERHWFSGPCSAASGNFGTLSVIFAAVLGALFHSVKF